MTEISDLVVHSLNGTLDQQNLQRLETLLQSNPQALEYYTEIVLVHTNIFSMKGTTYLRGQESAVQDWNLWHDLLKQEMNSPTIPQPAKEKEEEKSIPEPMAMAPRKPDKLSLFSILVSSAALFYLLLLAHFGTPQKMSYGTLLESYDATWSDPSFQLRPGDKISSQPLSLADGLLKIRMNDNSIVLIQGRTEFSLDNDSQLFLAGGKLTATVPKEAVGFTVRTPSASIVDYGTEFAVAVDNKANTEAHVKKGQVELRLGSNTRVFNQSIRLSQNQAGRASDNHLSEIPPSPEQFVFDISSPFEAYARSLNPAIYLGLTNNSPQSLQNRTPYSGIQFQINPDLTVVAGPALGGANRAWAFQFDNPQDKITVNKLPALPQAASGCFTTCYWIRFDSIKEQLVSAHRIQSSDLNYLRTTYMTENGALQHVACHNKNNQWRKLNGNIVLKPDKWYFFTIVNTGGIHNTKKMYLNGKKNRHQPARPG